MNIYLSIYIKSVFIETFVDLKHMIQILEQLINKNGSLFGIIATIYAIKMNICFFLSWYLDNVE